MEAITSQLKNEVYRINEKIIDTHLHIQEWDGEEGSFIDAFEKHRELSGLHSLNICALPTHHRVVGNNIMLAFYKLAHPNTYIHGSIDYIDYPIKERLPEGMDAVTQYRELMEMGFDGIKMLDGKPTYHSTIGKDINAPAILPLYEAMEKDGAHIVYHINDPRCCWGEGEMSEGLQENGWFYNNENYLSYDEIYDQAMKMLENYPKLCVTLAHFFFCSDTPNRVEALFEKYPNLCIDITPGCEMYHSFEANYEYFKDFFTKYSDRILLGTDGTSPLPTKGHVWCIDRLYRFIATNDKMMAFDDCVMTGLNLPTEAKENVLFKNFERRVSPEPAPINKARLRGYIEKYKHLLKKDDLERINQLADRYL